MTLEEFGILSPRQYANKVKGHIEQFNEVEENNLRRSRLIAFYVARGWQVKNNKIKQPTDIFKLPSEEVVKIEREPMTRDEAQKLAKRWEKTV